MTDINKPLMVSRVDEGQDVLQERFQEWGYLYFQNYVSAEKCDALLKDIMQELQPHLAFNAAGNPELVGEPITEADEIWDKVYPEIQSLERFHGFFHEPDIQSLMELVQGKEVFVYPIKMARVATPKKLGYETPPHQDAHSHQAGPTMAGMWVALHDAGENMGRLKMLPKSHKRGVRNVHEALGVGGVQCEIFPEETEWHVSNVGKGDVIIFNSCTVHKAEPNSATTAARISVDTRFCDYGAPVYCLNTEPHHGWRIECLDWDYIYRNWENAALQRYWEDYPHFWGPDLAEKEKLVRY